MNKCDFLSYVQRLCEKEHFIAMLSSNILPNKGSHWWNLAKRTVHTRYCFSYFQIMCGTKSPAQETRCDKILKTFERCVIFFKMIRSVSTLLCGGAVFSHEKKSGNPIQPSCSEICRKYDVLKNGSM